MYNFKQITKNFIFYDCINYQTEETQEKMENKHLKILFLYPNLHMSTLIPNGIAILSAALKQNGFKNIQLFDPTFYQSPEETRAMMGW